MSCGCNDKKAKSTETPVESVPYQRLAITCNCGLFRMLPTGLQVGDEFELVPCPKCNVPFKGKFVGDGAEQL